MSKKERKKIKKLKKKLRGYKEKELKEKKPKLNINPETRRGVVAVVLFTLAIILILSFQGVGGSLGEYLFKGSGFVFGNCLWLIYLISWPFLKIFGFWVTLVVFIAAILISILISFNISLRKIPKKEEEGEAGEKISQEIKGMTAGSTDRRVTRFVKGILKKPTMEVKDIAEEGEESLNKKEEKEEELIPTTKIGIKEYTFPPLELLESDKGYPSSGDVKTNVAIIQKTLENFGIPVEVGEVKVGPQVDQYTLKPP